MSAHHHDHKHNHLSLAHLHEHPICVATIIYNILVLAVEIIIIAAVSDIGVRDLLAYEGVMQSIHLLGVIALGIFNRFWIHRRSQHHDTRLQNAGKFFSVSSIMLIAHIVLLHLIPRRIGFELHAHEEGHENSELIEYVSLALIIIFVTLAFRGRDYLLEKTGLKNKFTVSFKKPAHEKAS